MLDIEGIVAIVERGKADHIVNLAKKAGAKGATIVYGRGTGEAEAKKFLNLHIESSKEIIIILVESDNVDCILNTVVEAGRLNEPGTGIAFTFPVDRIIGLHIR
ncbi:MAG: P-II family nitrogen regulator [Xylanivirga thermophila]|jgi:nitrogen regulatory protein P-II 1|uniref:P-II family nitrogen regulator n=1 Tax=Xylanivirga thermophila TaxID=2496273 RepID=UPI00101B66C4|nr:P-II family nitrogen regulator [Xylanivirga thermophila]